MTNYDIIRGRGSVLSTVAAAYRDIAFDAPHACHRLSVRASATAASSLHALEWKASLNSTTRVTHVV